MKKLILLAALAALPAVPGDVMATVRAGDVSAITCHGCNESQRYSKISKTGHEGTVYVFDSERANVHKYSVFTEVISLRPYTAFTAAQKVKTEPDLVTAYRDYVISVDNLLEEGRIVLPSDFPVRSVAGALYDPAFASTSIEDHLKSMELALQMQNNLTTLMLRLIKVKVPVFEGNLLVDNIILTFEYPDGSTLDYVLSVSVNSLSGEAMMEAEAHGNARLADGSPAPTSALGFRRIVFDDRNGSLFEWIQYARSFGINIIEGGNGRAVPTRMHCYTRGALIICVIIARR